MESLNPVAPAADVVILGVPLWDATFEEFEAWWDARLWTERGTPGLVFFANAHTLTMARSNPAMADALRAADVVANDGIGVRIAARLRGLRLKTNLNGTDLIPGLLSHLRRKTRVFLYGGLDEVNAAAAARIGARFPNAVVCGRIHGFVQESEAVAAINASNADLVLVGTGHPRQELFCHRFRTELRCGMLMSCGALFAFIAGDKPRAPRWMQRSGIEWLHRMSLEPRRLAKRYLVGNPVFLTLSTASIPADRRMARTLREQPRRIGRPISDPVRRSRAMGSK